MTGSARSRSEAPRARGTRTAAYDGQRAPRARAGGPAFPDAALASIARSPLPLLHDRVPATTWCLRGLEVLLPPRLGKPAPRGHTRAWSALRTAPLLCQA